MVICLEQGADLHMAQLMPLPLTVSCFSKIQIGFTFLVSAHLGRPGKRAVKRVCVCVCVCNSAFLVFCSQLELHVKKKEIFWITVPCIDNIGSCTYDNLCEMFAIINCPAPFKKYGIPCQCPVAKVSSNLFLRTFSAYFGIICGFLFQITV